VNKLKLNLLFSILDKRLKTKFSIFHPIFKISCIATLKSKATYFLLRDHRPVRKNPLIIVCPTVMN